MPDAPDDVAALRAENGRLRVLLEDKDARIAELEERIARLERLISRNSLLTEQRSVFPQLNGLMAVSGYTVTGHDRRAGTGPRGTGGGPGGQAGEHRGSV